MSKVDVYDLGGKKVEEIELPSEIFEVDVNEKLVAQAVRVYLAKARQGTRLVKTRGEVVGSRRKIWRQKGTGRARHGDRYAPIFVGGGIAHGPKAKDFSLKLNKKMRKKALRCSLSAKFAEGKVKIVVGIEKLTGKTSQMAEVLGNLGLFKKGKRVEEKILLVLAKNRDKVIRGGRNIENLKICQVRLINCYEVLANRWLVLEKESVGVLKETFLGGEKKEKGGRLIWK